MSTVSLTPNEQAVWLAVWNTIVAEVLTSPVTVIQQQQNRTATPTGDAIVMRYLYADWLNKRVETASFSPSPSPGVGSQTIARNAEEVYQLDVFGPNAQDNANTLAIFLESSYGCAAFASTPLQPLYCSAPRLVEWVNDQDQYEKKYALTLHLQRNTVVTITTVDTFNQASITGESVESISPE